MWLRPGLGALVALAKLPHHCERIYACGMGVAPEELKGVAPYGHPVQGLDILPNIRQGYGALPCHFTDAVSAATFVSQVAVAVVALVGVVPEHVDAIWTELHIFRDWLAHDG